MKVRQAYEFDTWETKAQAWMSHHPSLVLYNKTLEHFHTHPTPVLSLNLITLLTKCLYLKQNLL